MQFLIFLGALQICDRAQNTDGLYLLLHIFTFSSAEKQNDRITAAAVCLRSCALLRLRFAGRPTVSSDRWVFKLPVFVDTTIDQRQTIQVPEHWMCYFA